MPWGGCIKVPDNGSVATGPDCMELSRMFSPTERRDLCCVGSLESTFKLALLRWPGAKWLKTSVFMTVWPHTLSCSSPIIYYHYDSWNFCSFEIERLTQLHDQIAFENCHDTTKCQIFIHHHNHNSNNSNKYKYKYKIIQNTDTNLSFYHHRTECEKSSDCRVAEGTHFVTQCQAIPKSHWKRRPWRQRNWSSDAIYVEKVLMVRNDWI